MQQRVGKWRSAKEHVVGEKGRERSRWKFVWATWTDKESVCERGVGGRVESWSGDVTVRISHRLNLSKALNQSRQQGQENIFMRIGGGVL